MLDGIDWVSDRDWERSLFQRQEPEDASDTLALRYPAFRTPRVISVKRGSRPRGRGGKRTFG